jgi:hypothetical protein
VERYGLDTTGIGKAFFNNMVWDVFFEHISDRKLLNKAIGMMSLLIRSDTSEVSHIDTYANLLYKAGRIKDALEWEERAATLAEEQAAKGKIKADSVYIQTLIKMKKGMPTWCVSEDDKKKQ